VLPYYNREKRVLEKSDAAPSSPNIM
jgi:hypothetical protein